MDATLAQALRGQSIAVLATACAALKTAGLPATALVPLLIPGLEHPSSCVQEATVRALGSAGKGSLQAETVLISIASAQKLPHLGFTALKSLGELNSPSSAVLSQLCTALQSPSDYVCRLAVEGLTALTAQAEPACAALITVLGHPSFEVWYGAQVGIIKLAQGSPKALDSVLQALSHPDFTVRRILLKVLAAAGKGSEKVARALVGALNDPDPNVHNWVPEALVAADGEMGYSVPLLLAHLKNRREEPGLRCRAVTTLGLLGKTTPEVLTSLIEALHEPGLRFEHAWQLRFASVEALGLLGKDSPEVLAALTALLPEDHNLHAVATALGRVGKGRPEVAALLIGVVSRSTMERHKSNPMSPYALRALGSVGVPSPEAVEATARALDHTDYSVREAAAEVLGIVGVGSRRAAAALCRMLSDPLHPVQEAAVRSLGTVGLSDPQIVQALLDTESHSVAVQTALVETLRLLVEKDPKALSLLTEALQSTKWQTRRTAEETLQALSPTSSPTPSGHVESAEPAQPDVDVVPKISLEEHFAAIDMATQNVHQAAHQALESLSWADIMALKSSVQQQLTLVRKVVLPRAGMDGDQTLVFVGAMEAANPETALSLDKATIFQERLEQCFYE